MESRDELLASVRLRGGVVRSADLVRRGVPAKLIATAVSLGQLIRVRRVWVAVPDADPFLLAAARRGVALSCVTRLERAGGWIFEAPAKPHVAAHPHSGRTRFDTAVVHRARPLLARAPDMLEDHIENALDLVAQCLPAEAALAAIESILHMGMVTRPALERLSLSSALRDLLVEATPFPDSGLESLVPRRLRWLGVRIVAQVVLAGHAVDFLIGERLVLQIDGGHHVGRQREEDIRHDADLMLLGYHVIRVGYAQVVDDWPAVQEMVLRAVAQGLHLAA